MKQTNLTAYGTVSCRIELNHADMVALGIEVSKVKNYLASEEFKTYIKTKDESDMVMKEHHVAIENLICFLDKFVETPSQSNVFTDSPLDFKKADETTTAVEPAPTDNVITVDISKSENLEDLAKIVRHATDLSKDTVDKHIVFTKVSGISCISFKCTKKNRETVIDKLVNSGYVIVSNEMPAVVFNAKDNMYNH